MKPHFNIFATVLLAACTAFAVVPLKWSVETSRAATQAFDAYHGETLALDASLLSYGQPLDLTGQTAQLYYQTNGMDEAWWSVPATISATNHITVTFAPDADPGAKTLTCFLGVTGSVYRAAFRIRFLNSPGATPNVLELPTVTYDAALYGTPTINGTNLTQWVAARSGEEYDPRAPAIVSNIVTKAFVEDLGIQAGGTDASAVKASAGTATNLTVKGRLFVTDTVYTKDTLQFTNSDSDYRSTAAWLSFGAGTFLPTWSFEDQSLGEQRTETLAFASDVSSISNTVHAWETYWDGDDVRVTVTNYYGALDIPSLYIEQNTNTVTGGSAVYRTVWDERTRWNAFLPGYATFTNNVVQNYADRAWGVYDSSTGEYSPDGIVQVSQQQIQIASGLAYQKTLTTGGNAIWVLSATEPMTYNGQTNGFFRISDGDGNALIEIVKGDKRTVGATATGITVNNGMQITYSVNSQPTLYVCTNLLDAAWLSESECSSLCTVSWTQSSTNFVASVTPAAGTNPPRMFAKATYVVGGETYVRHSCPIGLTNLYIGGTNYTVKVETMNGKKVLVLQ